MKWQEIKNRLTHSLQRFFYGRNGSDHLSIFILICSILLSLLGQLLRIKWLFLFYYLGVIIALYRILSKNVYQRRRENQWFLLKIQEITKTTKLWKRMYQERHTHKYLKCPECKQRLRVPKGKGKIEITCSKCKHHFIKTV